MRRHILASFVLSAVTLAAPRLAAADTLTSFDAVDAVEMTASGVKITGIVAGQSEPSSVQLIFGIGNEARAERCERLALLAMAQPGRFEFVAIETPGSAVQDSCKLAVRAP